MKKNFWLIGIALFIFSVGTLGPLFAGSAGPVEIGVAAAVKGEVKNTSVAAVRSLKSGDKVFMGDFIETGKEGQLQILLLDQTVFTLGPLSAIKMDEFIYDPATDDGKVKTSMVKGIFRVVSGKVAHKKPENMSVELPAGTIGFRGTNVAGIIDGAKTLVVLLGPVGTGRVSVSNWVNGEIVEVEIDKAGNATVIEGPNVAPVTVFQVSEADLNRIADALGQSVTGTETGPGDPDAGMNAGSSQSQGTSVDAQMLMRLLNTQDLLNQKSQTAAQDAARDAAGTTSSSSSSVDNTRNIKTSE